jgi:hypothetical protein
VVAEENPLHQYYLVCNPLSGMSKAEALALVDQPENKRVRMQILLIQQTGSA